MKSMAFAIALSLFTVGASGQELCQLSQDEANASPQCLRWYSLCLIGGAFVTGEPAPEYAALSLDQRRRFFVEAGFAIAERQCLQYDYVQANAAKEAKLRDLGLEDVDIGR